MALVAVNPSSSNIASARSFNSGSTRARIIALFDTHLSSGGYSNVPHLGYSRKMPELPAVLGGSPAGEDLARGEYGERVGRATLGVARPRGVGGRSELRTDVCHPPGSPAVRAPQRHVRAELAVRDALVRTRTRYVALVKTLVRRDGLRVTSSESHLVAQRIGALSPSPALEAELQPLFTVLAPLNEQIAAADRRVATLLDSPGDYGVLAKLVARAIIYRLCLG